MKKTRFALLWILLLTGLLGGAPPASSAVEGESYDAILDRLEAHFARWQHGLPDTYLGTSEKRLLLDAVRELKSNLAKKVQDYRALVLYGRACIYAFHLDLEEPREAADSLQKAIRIDETNPAAHYYLGTLYTYMPGMQAEAIEEFGKCLKLGGAKRFPKAFRFVSEAFWMKGVRAPQEEAQTLGKAGPTYYSAGQGFSKERVEALKALDRYLRIDPFDALARELTITYSNTIWGQHIHGQEDTYQYVNDEYGFSFAFPSHWFIKQENLRKGHVMLNIPSREGDGAVNSNAVAVYSRKYAAGTNIDRFMDEWEGSSSLKPDSIKTVERSDSFCLKAWEAKRGATQFSGRYVYMVKRNTGIFVMFSSTPHSIARTGTEFNSFVESLRLQ